MIAVRRVANSGRVLIATAVLAGSCLLAASFASPAIASGQAGVPAAGTPSMYGWGTDSAGQLGDGLQGAGTLSVPEGIDLPGAIAVTSIAAGAEGGLAIGSDGNLYGWGGNSHGQVGNGGTSEQDTPAQITLASGITPVAIAAGQYTSYAIGSDGNLYAWGDNADGDLGDGSTTDQDAPEVITLAAGVTPVAIAAGADYALAIGSDGNLYAWGDDSAGQLGDGGQAEQDAPEVVTLPGGVTPATISAGTDFSFAIGTDGNLYAWGDEDSGALGDGSDTGAQLTPEQIVLPGSVTAASVTAAQSAPLAMAIGSDGNLYAWGANGDGEVGNGGSDNVLTPAKVTLAAGVKPAFAAPGKTSYAIGSDGFLYAWGAAAQGTPDQEPLQLGSGAQVASGALGAQFALATSGASRCQDDAFTSGGPPLTWLAGTSYTAFFAADGCPPPTYGLSDAPDWLSIDPSAGTVTGTPPDGTTSFSYTVFAVIGAQVTDAGPFSVTLTTAATITGTVQASDGTPASGVTVQSCLTSGAQCTTAVTASDGSFSLTGAASGTVELTAFPVAGGSAGDATLGPLAVGSGLSGQTLTLPTTAGSLGGGLTINGSGQAPATLQWGSTATAKITGACASGLAAVSLTSTDPVTGQQGSRTAALTENPAGSGSYTGTLPQAYPLHGAGAVAGVTACPGSSNLVPATGPVAGGADVIVTGSGFAGATSVLFGSVPSPGFVVESASSIVAVAPPGTGDVNVSVVTPSGTVQLGTHGVYSYLGVTGVSPASGPATGGSTVTITGGGFSQATAVDFGSTPATSFTVLSDTQIKATAPGGTGTADVQVTGPMGTTATSAADQFSYSGNGQPAGPVLQVTPQQLALPGGFAIPALPPAFSPPALACLTAACIRTWLAAVSTQLTSQGLATITSQVGQDLTGQLAGYLPELTSQLGQGSCTAAGQTTAVSTLDAAASTITSGVVSAVVNVYLPEAFAALGTAGQALTVSQGQAAFLTAIRLQWTSTLQALLSAVVAAQLEPAEDAAVQQAVNGECTNPDPDPAPVAVSALIDPSGTVVDTSGGPVGGASVTVTAASTPEGPFTAVDQNSAGIEPGVNPETTGSGGVFHWDVSAGYYQVQATAQGCFAPGDPGQQTASTGIYPVPPPQAGLILTLQCPADSAPPHPAVTGLSETAGQLAGGDRVTITGTGFTPGATVAFGSEQATQVSYVSGKELQAKVPAGSAGTVDVTVGTLGGTSATSAADQFSYAAQPAVTGISPGSGPVTGGTKVTITGHGFSSASSVAFGLSPATAFTVVSDSKITATAPAGATGAVHVTVSAPGGQTGQVAGDQFSYLQSSTATTIATSGSPSGNGAPVTFTATVTPAPDNGSVQFAADGKNLGSPVPVNPFTGKAVAQPVSTLAGGSHQVTASYLGDGSYSTSASQPLSQQVISPQAITFTSKPPGGPRAGTTYDPAATGGGSGNPVMFSIDKTSMPGTCSLAGQTVQFTAAGLCVLDANQAASTLFTAAPQVSQSVTIAQIPFFVMTSPPRSGPARRAYGYAFLAEGSPEPGYALGAGSPKWLSVNAKTGLVTGTPPAGTTSFRYSVIASNAAGKATAGPFTVQVAGSAAASANLTTTLTCPASATVRTAASCTLSVHNAGPAKATQVKAALVLPAVVTATPANGGQVLGTVVTWSIGSLASGNTAKRAVTVKGYAAGSASLSAMAWSPANPDPAPAGNFTTRTLSIVS